MEVEMPLVCRWCAAGVLLVCCWCAAEKKQIGERLRNSECSLIWKQSFCVSLRQLI